MFICWRHVLNTGQYLCYRHSSHKLPKVNKRFPAKTLHTITNSENLLGRDIYISASLDPYFNLSLEDCLFRQSAQSSPLLLIYRNKPCVVIGRNQNPWTEVNFAALRAADIPLIRRRSGGGTVYHDTENTNYSIHLPRPSFDRKATGQIVLRAVRSLGIDAILNERNDICVSGSAYKIVTKRAYHHGTMLISTSLDTLGEVLHPPKQNIVTKGVSSVRSPVCNLQQFNPAVSNESFTAALVAEFRKAYGISTEACVVHDTQPVKDIEHIRNGMAELSSWEWKYAQTPQFTQFLHQSFSWGEVKAEVRCKHGLIVRCLVDIQSPGLLPSITEKIERLFGGIYENRRYGFCSSSHLTRVDKENAVAFKLDDTAAHGHIELIQDIWSWLAKAMHF